MRGLAGEELLKAWEQSRMLPAQQAALVLLELAEPDQAARQWARLPLGERDALLLELRAATLGRRMEGFAVCPVCGAQLEFSADALELSEGLRALAIPVAAPEENPMRPANTLDLLSAAAATSEAEARSILLARAARAADEDAEAIQTAEDARCWLEVQPESMVNLLAEQFERVNEAAEVRIELACVECGKLSALDLDIASYILREIGAAARRLMVEIHELAQAYGWSEAAIAAMSCARRAAYLEMVGA